MFATNLFSKFKFGLSNGSTVTAASTSSDVGRSDSLSLLIIDEAAFVDGLNDLWAAISPTITTGGRCIALSTPFGVGSWFHKTYVDAEEGKNNFHSTKIMWDEHPDRDDKWFEYETKNLDKRKISSEYLCLFNASGETVFHIDDINYLENFVKEPKYKTAFDRNLWIWEEYKSKETYLISADVARGDGEDFSAFHIFKLETMEIIAEYKGKIAPDVLANLLCSIGTQYGNCMIVVENNNIGYHVAQKLVELSYPNVYYEDKQKEQIEQYVAEAKGSAPGFNTSVKTRPLIIAKMEEFIRNKVLVIYSKRLLNELRTFVWRNGKPESLKGYNDDLTISCAIGCWIRDTVLISNKRELEYTKSFLNSIIKTNTAFDTRISGMRHPYNGTMFNDTKVNTDPEVIDLMKEFDWIYKG
jgi:hypothetical protein